jgi:hypothetical protein
MYILEIRYFSPGGGGGASANVIWGKVSKGERKKEKNEKEKAQQTEILRNCSKMGKKLTQKGQK